MKYLFSLVILFFIQQSFAQTANFRYEGRLNGPTITAGAMPGQSFSVSLKRPDNCGGNLGLSAYTTSVTLQNGAFSLSPSFNSTLLAQAMNPWNDFGGCSIPEFNRQMVINWGGESFTVDIADTPRANLATHAINSSKIGNVAVQSSLSCSSNQVLKFNSGTAQFECLSIAASDVPLLSASSIPSFSGDVTGPITSTSVDKIKGVTVAAGTPVNGQVLKFNGVSWAPAADDTGGSSDATYAAKGLVQLDTSAAVSGLSFTSSGIIKLSNTGVSAGSYGNSLSTLQMTVDSQGRISSLSQVAVDDTSKLSLAGGTMTGNINMGGNQITNVNSVSSNDLSGRNLFLYDSGIKKILFKSPITLPSDYTLTLPVTDGNAGEFLTTDGTGVLSWTTPGASGITSLNGLTAPSQTFATAVSGAAPNFSSAGSVHTLNIPSASSGGVTSGTINNTEYQIFNNKLTSPLTTKGDLLTRDSSTHVRLPAGTDGQILSADSAQVSGLRWITPPVGGTVTSVSSGNSYLSVVTPTSTPVITANVGTAANTLAAGDDARINGALQTSVYDADVLPAASCGSHQMSYWNGVAGTWACQNIGNLNASAFTAGIVPQARLGAGTADSTTYLRGDGQWAVPAGGGVPLDATLTYRVRAATTGNITLSGNQTIDGVTTATGDRVLVKNQTLDQMNGVYIANSTGWSRATDMDTWPETLGAQVQVIEGTTWAGSRFLSSSTLAGTINSTSITWSSVATAPNSNTAFGSQALTVNSPTGAHNSAFGSIALKSNTTGSGNTAMGSQALNSNTTGFNSTAIGKNSLGANVSGSGNTALGYFAGNSTVGSNNTFIGANSGASVTSGNNNVIIGSNNGSVITASNNNILFSDGSGSLRMLVDSLGNVGIGTTSPSSTLDVNGAMSLRGASGIPTAPAGQSRIYFDSTSNTLKLSQNGGAYSDILTSAAGGAGDITDVIAGAGLTGGSSSGSATLAADTTSVNGLFKNGGNSFSGPATLGTENPNNLDILTNGTSRITISGSGGIGIGTPLPHTGDRLDINGSINFRGQSAPPAADSFEGRIYFDNTSNKFRVSEDGSAYKDLINTDFVTNADYIDDLSRAGCTANQTAYFNFAMDYWDCMPLNVTTPGGFIIDGGNNMSGPITIGQNNFQPVYFETNGQTQMTITNTGKVGIGTTSPTAQFQVQSPAYSFAGNAETIHFATNVNQATNHSGTYSGLINETSLAGPNTINISNNSELNVANGSPTSVSESNNLKLNSQKTGTGTTNAQNGIANFIQINNGTVNFATGLQNLITTAGTGAAGNAIGSTSQINNGSSSSMLSATAISGTVDGTLGNITTATGIELGLTGNIVNGYGLKIGTIAGSTTRYAIFQSDSAAKNYFNGNVGIGLTAPAYKLDVQGDVNINASSSLRFGGTQICNNTGCMAISDVRYKKNIEPLDHPLEKIISLQGVQYDWIDKERFGDKHQVGLIAQDLEKVFPEVVLTDSKSGYKTVAYDHLIAPVIEAIKKLYARIQGVEAQVSQIQSNQSRDIASVQTELAAKDQEIALLKLKAAQSEKENAEMKARLDKIEQLLEKK